MHPVFCKRRFPISSMSVLGVGILGVCVCMFVSLPAPGLAGEMAEAGLTAELEAVRQAGSKLANVTCMLPSERLEYKQALADYAKEPLSVMDGLLDQVVFESSLQEAPEAVVDALLLQQVEMPEPLETTWSASTGTLQRVGPIWDTGIEAGEPEAMAWQFMDSYAELLGQVLEGDLETEAVLKDYAELDDGVVRVTFQREVSGISVPGQWLRFVFAPNPYCPATMGLVSLSANWFGVGPEAVSFPESAGEAVFAAVAGLDEGLEFYPYEPYLTWHVEHGGQVMDLAWTVHAKLQNEHWKVLVSVADLLVVEAHSTTRHVVHDGTVRATALKPYQSSRALRPLQWLDVWGPVGGGSYTYAGSANDAGNYAIDFEGDGTSVWRSMGFRGIHALDSDYVPDDTIFNRDTGADFSFSDEYLQGGADAYYMFNHYWSMADTFMQAGPDVRMCYSFKDPDNTPYGLGCAATCCEPCMADYQNPPDAENNIWLGICSNPPEGRWAWAHEYSHATRLYVAGPVQATDTFGLKLDEGRSDWFSYMSNRYEFVRPPVNNQCGYVPDAAYTGTWSANIYCNGNVFAALFNDLSFTIGERNAARRVVDGIGDGFVGYEFIDGTSTFIDTMLIHDQDINPLKVFRSQISAVFERHDTSMAPSAFPWADQLPNTRDDVVVLEPGLGATTFAGGPSGPSNSLDALAIDNTFDCDIVTVPVYAGDTYVFSTLNLASGLDTALSIWRVENGVSTQLAFNNDCPGQGLASCISYSATTNEWLAISVCSYLGSSTGSYNLQVSHDDDACDDAGFATPLPINNTTSTTYHLSTAADQDWFKLYLPSSASTVNVVVTPDCAPVRACAYTAGNLTTPLACIDAPLGGGTLTVTSPSMGWYAVRLTTIDSVVCSYTLRSYLGRSGIRDTDLGYGTKEYAMALSLVSKLVGTRVATDLQSSSDVDWFKVQLTEGQHVTFEVTDVTSGCEVELQVHDDGTMGYKDIPDATKRWLLSDVSAGFEGARLHFVAPKAAYFYARVAPSGVCTSATYSFNAITTGHSEVTAPAFR